MKCKKRRFKIPGVEGLNVINGPINVVKSYMKMMSHMKVLYVITFGPDFLKAHVARLRLLRERRSRLRRLRSRLVASLNLALNVINS